MDMLRCAVRALAKSMFGSDVEGSTDLVIRACKDVNAYINPISVSNLLAAARLGPALGHPGVPAIRARDARSPRAVRRHRRAAPRELASSGRTSSA